MGSMQTDLKWGKKGFVRKGQQVQVNAEARGAKMEGELEEKSSNGRADQRMGRRRGLKMGWNKAMRRL
eukprot:4571626-Pleurochrysis_carterae.AAC.3